LPAAYTHLALFGVDARKSGAPKRSDFPAERARTIRDRFWSVNSEFSFGIGGLETLFEAEKRHILMFQQLVTRITKM
jgi:hypothetical protein